MSERKLLGEGLTFEEKLALAQLVNQAGWKILVKLMAEACRHATEEVIKLKPTQERYSEVLTGLQTTAHAMNKFSADVLDSVKLQQRSAVLEAQQRESPTAVFEPPQRFRMPIESPAKEPTQN
jgi:TRAP-type mannitol/chloroaromatic compound transport system substrate-binding protein